MLIFLFHLGITTVTMIIFPFHLHLTWNHCTNYDNRGVGRGGGGGVSHDPPFYINDIYESILLEKIKHE